MKKYIIYMVRNIRNGKIYIGAHRTEDLDDGYLGSGIGIRRAIQKYGRDAFEKQILLECSSEKEMYTQEAEIVNELFISREDTYNANVGGHRGPSHAGYRWVTNEKGENRLILDQTDPPAGWWFGKTKLPAFNWITDGTENRQLPEGSAIPLGFRYGLSNRNCGNGAAYITNGIETKRWRKDEPLPEGFRWGNHKLQKSVTQMMWITDGINTKRIPKSSDIPIGWRKGRTLKSAGVSPHSDKV